MRRGGFTLIELMVVMAIIALLAGLLMPFITMASLNARRTATQAVMRKVDTALRQFKTDYQAYPYQRSYPDLAAGEAWSNRLYHHVGTTIAADERDRVLADMDTAARAYDYDCTSAPGRFPQERPPVSPHVFRANRGNGRQRMDGSGEPESDIAPYNWVFVDWANAWHGQYEDALAGCMVLNRMAQERARLLMLIGAVDATGVTMRDVPGRGGVHRGRDLSGTPLVAAPVSDARPGWAVDYLRGELEARSIDGETVLDAWGRPLIYLCQVQPGCRGTVHYPLTRFVYMYAPENYGLAPIGRTVLQARDPATGVGLAAHPERLPDPDDLWRSDRRFYAAPGFELEFELWSAGPDGRFAWMRDDPVNRDNVACDRYDDGLR